MPLLMIIMTMTPNRPPRYSAAERLLHRLAFATVPAQKAASDLEDRLFARRFAPIPIDRPVFITALPRAGTTLLLELLAALPNFASHTYRTMPFLFTPLLWDAVSRPFRQPNAAMPRAHGDGMTVGYDSPEGFEEMLWRAFWPQQYRPDRIIPWPADDQDADVPDAAGEFDDFIGNHIRKLLSLHPANASGSTLESTPAPPRYVSKNNANIARILAIRRLFPDAVIIVPFRNPSDHSAAMLRQHRNFLHLHAHDPFSRRYMAYTGHFDFGANLRPINFNGWLDGSDGDDNGDTNAVAVDSQTANFWLRYWCAAYAYILANHSDSIALLDYDACCDNPITSLRQIAAAVGLGDPTTLANQSTRFRPPTQYDAATMPMTPELRRRADAIYQQLLQNAINRPDSP